MAAASACVAGTDVSGGFVWVSAERLRALESLEAELPALLEKTHNEAIKKHLENLHKKDKENPDAHKERAKKWKDNNRDAYNARRRELYRQKKEAAAPTAAPAGSRS